MAIKMNAGAGGRAHVYICLLNSSVSVSFDTKHFIKMFPKNDLILVLHSLFPSLLISS